MIRAYLAAAIVIAASLAYWRYTYISDELDRTKATLAQANWVISEEKRLSEESKEASKNYQSRQEDLQRENINLRNDIESGKRRMRVEIKNSQMPCSNIPDGSGSSYAELSENARRDILNLRFELGVAQNKIAAFEEMKKNQLSNNK